MYIPSFVTDKFSTVPDCRIQDSCSDDDASCSRSAAIDGTKRYNPAASFTTEMVQSRKRRRRRRKDKILKQNTNGVDSDKGKGESEHTMSQLIQPISDVAISAHTSVLETHLQTNSATTCGNESSRDGTHGMFQLFVHIEGDSDGEEPTCQSERGRQESKQSQCKKMKTRTKQALRGGSAHYCDKRTRKRLLKGSLCKTKHHPRTELSNCHTSITSMGATQSNSVSKQGALCDESYDRLKGKELKQSHTPPAVDTGCHITEVTHYEGSKTHREASMEKSGHSRRVTRGNSGHRRRVMRYRKGRRIIQVCQLLS